MQQPEGNSPGDRLAAQCAITVSRDNRTHWDGEFTTSTTEGAWQPEGGGMALTLPRVGLLRLSGFPIGATS